MKIDLLRSYILPLVDMSFIISLILSKLKDSKSNGSSITIQYGPAASFLFNLVSAASTSVFIIPGQNVCVLPVAPFRRRRDLSAYIIRWLSLAKSPLFGHLKR